MSRSRCQYACCGRHNEHPNFPVAEDESGIGRLAITMAMLEAMGLINVESIGQTGYCERETKRSKGSMFSWIEIGIFVHLRPRNLKIMRSITEE